REEMSEEPGPSMRLAVGADLRSFSSNSLVPGGGIPCSLLKNSLLFGGRENLPLSPCVAGRFRVGSGRKVPNLQNSLLFPLLPGDSGETHSVCVYPAHRIPSQKMALLFAKAYGLRRPP